MAALHALLYVALFMGIQLIVSFAYSFILSMSMSISHLAAGGTLEGDALTAFSESIVEIVNNNLHTMMLLSGLITILTLVISFRLRKKTPAEEMHIRKIPLLRAPWYVVFGVALQPVTNLLLNFLPTSLLMDFEEQNALADAAGPLAMEILNVVILTPIVEELIFRGLAFTRLRRGMSTALAVLISAAVFGAVHGHPVSFLYASVLGVVLAWIMRKNNDSVIAPILCHAGFNGGNYLLQALLGDTDNPLLFFSVTLASAAILVLSGFMILRPIPAGDTRE
jgi:membrane protease YdiL (CAAX protease family)